MIELQSGYTLINKGWRFNHGVEEKMRLYFSKDEKGKECIFLDTNIKDVLEEMEALPTLYPFIFARVFWGEQEKKLSIHPTDPREEGTRAIDLKELFEADTIRRWRDADIEALLKAKAPIEDGIGYYVDGEWDSDRQCLIYDLNKRKPIKEGVTA